VVAGGGGPARVKVVRVRGGKRILEVLGSLLSDFSYTATYDIVVDENRGVYYKYEVLHVAGRVSGEPVAVTCDRRGCTVEAPLYKHEGVEPCRCKPNPAKVADCVRAVAEGVAGVKRRVEGLRALARELERHGFQVDLRSSGAEAYRPLGRSGHIKAYLYTRFSMLQLYLRAGPAEVAELAKRLAEMLGGGWGRGGA
jgi:hypothetical protein